MPWDMLSLLIRDIQLRYGWFERNMFTPESD